MRPHGREPMRALDEDRVPLCDETPAEVGVLLARVRRLQWLPVEAVVESGRSRMSTGPSVMAMMRFSWTFSQVMDASLSRSSDPPSHTKSPSAGSTGGNRGQSKGSP